MAHPYGKWITDANSYNVYSVVSVSCVKYEKKKDKIIYLTSESKIEQRWNHAIFNLKFYTLLL